jgi:hypothetical protein
VETAARPLVPVEQEGSLSPGKQAECPLPCSLFFAGATATDATVCQYAASGVGTAGQKADGGVSCFPSYNCGKDWTMCRQIPAPSNPPAPSERAAAACAEIAGLNVGGDQPSPLGAWLKATGDLGCGWGSTYGNVDPYCAHDRPCATEGWDGTSKPYTVEYWNDEGVQDEHSCCLKAMELEKTQFEEGGAAVRFQYRAHNDYDEPGHSCRIDRERFLHGNLDVSGSGKPMTVVRDATCGGEDTEYFYRMAAGASDASNMKPGGRCVVEGGFERRRDVLGVMEGGVGSFLPAGKLPHHFEGGGFGAELPNHNCASWPNQGGGQGCRGIIGYNGISDAEECCEACAELKWIGGDSPMGGDASMNADGGYANPCVAWQIVDGICTIVREEYFDTYTPNLSVEQAVHELDERCDEYTGYRDTASEETCNYFSHIYWRPGNSPPLPDTGTNATFRRLVEVEVDIEATTVVLSANVVPQPHGRTEGRRDEMEGGPGSSALDLDETDTAGSAEGPPDCLTDCPEVEDIDCETFSYLAGVFESVQDGAMDWPVGSDAVPECLDDCDAATMAFVAEVVEFENALCNEANCGSIEIFPPAALMEEFAGTAELTDAVPICVSTCEHGEVYLECDIADVMAQEQGRRQRRRLQEDLQCVTGVRSGVCSECTCPDGFVLKEGADTIQGSELSTCCDVDSTVTLPISMNTEGDGYETVDFSDATIAEGNACDDLATPCPEDLCDDGAARRRIGADCCACPSAPDATTAPMCNFQMLMEAVDAAMENDDLGSLENSAIFRVCASVSHLMRNVMIASSCPGGEHVHGDSPAPPTYDGPMDGTACTRADAIRFTERGMTCPFTGGQYQCDAVVGTTDTCPDDTRDTECGQGGMMCVGDCPDCRERHPYTQCERAWEENHPLTPNCEACVGSLGEAAWERFSECMAPALMVPPCPSADPTQWPEVCMNLQSADGTAFGPDHCCPCIGVGGTCPPECDMVPEECHGILSCTVGGLQGGPVCPDLHATAGR